ncbi:hypothetical protein OEIGOIKO_00075 [Streptomyces chrestomyceticus JCM 4735]|uniref:Uncharacterized protein n=1 Tax=Streptomyces chrestomyceticus JCM 4735 TaxID=1306181 RepID=A0A7U9PUQ1_9ACTN|nr:hypothetical protein OEIGOIKO_00075 [Streptomyces chrestomyceticus JCM 4735]
MFSWTARRRPSLPGCANTPRCGSSAVTAPAPSATVPARARLKPGRWPMPGTCCTAWPRLLNASSADTAPTARTPHRLENPARRARLRGRRPGRAGHPRQAASPCRPHAGAPPADPRTHRTRRQPASHRPGTPSQPRHRSALRPGRRGRRASGRGGPPPEQDRRLPALPAPPVDGRLHRRRRPHPGDPATGLPRQRQHRPPPRRRRRSRRSGLLTPAWMPASGSSGAPRAPASGRRLAPPQCTPAGCLARSG